jgi:hypothetical protein
MSYTISDFLDELKIKNTKAFPIIQERMSSKTYENRNFRFKQICDSLSNFISCYDRYYLALKIEISLFNQSVEIDGNFAIAYNNSVSNFEINLLNYRDCITAYLYKHMIVEKNADIGTYMEYCRESIQDVLDDIESRDKIVPHYSELISCPYCKSYTCSTTLVQKRAIDEPASVNGWCYTCCKGFQG